MNFCGGVITAYPLCPPSPRLQQKKPQQHMTAASFCSDFISSAAQTVEMLINIDTSVTGILRLTIKYQFKTYKNVVHILSGIATNSAYLRR